MLPAQASRMLLAGSLQQAVLPGPLQRSFHEAHCAPAELGVGAEDELLGTEELPGDETAELLGAELLELLAMEELAGEDEVELGEGTEEESEEDDAPEE